MTDKTATLLAMSGNDSDLCAAYPRTFSPLRMLSRIAKPLELKARNFIPLPVAYTSDTARVTVTVKTIAISKFPNTAHLQARCSHEKTCIISISKMKFSNYSRYDESMSPERHPVMGEETLCSEVPPSVIALIGMSERTRQILIGGRTEHKDVRELNC